MKNDVTMLKLVKTATNGASVCSTRKKTMNRNEPIRSSMSCAMTSFRKWNVDVSET